MRDIVTCLIFAAGLCLPLDAHAAGPEVVAPADRSAALGVVGRRLALVVGTTDYKNGSAWPRLANAQGDAHALAAELERRYGFAVTWLEAPDATTFKTTLRQLSAEATPADDLFVFVAGHGHFDDIDNAGYLVFADGETDCTRGCYAFDNLKRSLFDSKARHILVMLDVCYGGTFDLRVALGTGTADRSRSDPEGLRHLLKDYARYPSRLVFASVGKAKTSDGPEGAHSPFMSNLLLTLARPGPNGVVSLDRLFIAMQDDGATARVQRPTAFEASTAHHPNGTFLFIEDVDFCDATQTIAGATAERFQSLKAEAVSTTDWATSWMTSWVVPGATQCRVWQWPSDGKAQVRCELGRFNVEAAKLRGDALFERLRQCLQAPDWQPSQSDRGHGDETVHDLVLTSSMRRVSVTSSCAKDCGVSLVFE